ncbi:MAG: helix-turn-helix domain-containing protein, partial [Clostridia bacterium]|nr:helix-turn-helix domain-containing protein [Clostridia bacterium]
MIKLGERIKELRLRDGRTQEALANALAVTPQAISRWENGICYPDMELIPSIANFFGASIDELFGYDNEREKKIDALAARINEMNRQNNGEDVHMSACIALAREALIEFPGNEKLTLALASALYNAGYVRFGEYHVTDPDGYSRYDTARHRTYAEWQEAVRLYEKLLGTLTDGEMRQQAVVELAQLYANLGEQEKAMRLAESAPDFCASKIFLRIKAFDGEASVAAYGEALIETVRTSAELVECIVLTDQNLPPRTSAEMLAN